MNLDSMPYKQFLQLLRRLTELERFLEKFASQKVTYQRLWIGSRSLLSLLALEFDLFSNGLKRLCHVHLPTWSPGLVSLLRHGALVEESTGVGGVLGIDNLIVGNGTKGHSLAQNRHIELLLRNRHVYGLDHLLREVVTIYILLYEAYLDLRRQYNLASQAV